VTGVQTCALPILEFVVYFQKQWRRQKNTNLRKIIWLFINVKSVKHVSLHDALPISSVVEKEKNSIPTSVVDDQRNDQIREWKLTIQGIPIEFKGTTTEMLNILARK